MGLKAYAKFQKILKLGHVPRRLGMEGDGGDVTRLSYRVRLARSFRGLNLDGIAQDGVVGYEALFRVFLAHSALERFLKLMKLKLDGLDEALKPYSPELVVKEFFELDSNGKLYDFLHPRLEGKMPEKLARCREGNSQNVGHISAAIRHIFVHGHLTSRSNGVTPTKLNKGCVLVSNFLLDYIDDAFEKRIDEYCAAKSIGLK